jgi:formylglycine-generating enzyme required for sulfatase activity
MRTTSARREATTQSSTTVRYQHWPGWSSAPNSCSLIDMAGNVGSGAGLAALTSPAADPHGPDTGSTRVGRGGNWNFYAAHCRDSYRYGNAPTDSATNIGFRCALPAS